MNRTKPFFLLSLSIFCFTLFSAFMLPKVKANRTEPLTETPTERPSHFYYFVPAGSRASNEALLNYSAMGATIQPIADWEEVKSYVQAGQLDQLILDRNALPFINQEEVKEFTLRKGVGIVTIGFSLAEMLQLTGYPLSKDQHDYYEKYAQGGDYTPDYFAVSFSIKGTEEDINRILDASEEVNAGNRSETGFVEGIQNPLARVGSFSDGSWSDGVNTLMMIMKHHSLSKAELEPAVPTDVGMSQMETTTPTNQRMFFFTLFLLFLLSLLLLGGFFGRKRSSLWMIFLLIRKALGTHPATPPWGLPCP